MTVVAEPGGLEIVIPARRLSAPATVELAQRAESLGWSGVWVSEVLGLDAAVLLGAMSRATSRIRLGTSIVPVSTRSAALLAMTASTVAQLAPGRFAFGVGVSTPAIVADRHDRPVQRPVALTAGVLSVMRQVLRGECVTHPADPRVQGLRIEPPEQVPPVLLAALGPRMIVLAHSHADGLILNLVTAAAAAELAAAARRAAGPAYPTLLTQRVCVDPSVEDVAAARREIASYCRVPVYADSLARQGWDLDELRAAPAEEAPRLLSDALFDQLAWLGSAADCRARIDALAASGVRPVVVPVGAGEVTGRLLAALSPRG